MLRAVSDPYDHTLPAAALAGFGTGGKTDIGAVLRSLAGDVRQLGALMRTGGEAGRAFRSLADARHFPGPGV